MGAQIEGPLMAQGRRLSALQRIRTAKPVARLHHFDNPTASIVVGCSAFASSYPLHILGISCQIFPEKVFLIKEPP
jgi:hypothetical protein